MTMKLAGKLTEVGSSGRSGDGFKEGGLGSLIMLGFGRPGATSASNMTGATSSAAAGNASLIADILGFKRYRSKTLE